MFRSLRRRLGRASAAGRARPRRGAACCWRSTARRRRAPAAARRRGSRWWSPRTHCPPVTCSRRADCGWPAGRRSCGRPAPRRAADAGRPPARRRRSAPASRHADPSARPDLTTGLPRGLVAVRCRSRRPARAELVRAGDRVDLLALPRPAGDPLVADPAPARRPARSAGHASSRPVLPCCRAARRRTGTTDLVVAADRATALRLTRSRWRRCSPPWAIRPSIAVRATEVVARRH